MYSRIIQYFYPDIKSDEIKKFSLLSLGFVFIIGTYWLMKLLKELILYKVAFPVTLGWSHDTGRMWIPTLKTISPIFVLCLVMIYSKLVDMFEKHKLLYVIISAYMVFFSMMTILLFCRHLYGDVYLGSSILAIFGVLGYLLTESFGSLAVALFWSFTISSSTSDQAKRAFPFIVASGQMGAILCSSLLLINTTIIWPFYAIVVLFLGFFIKTISYLVKTVSCQDLQSDAVVEKPKVHTVFSGFKLLATQPYLIGILVVSTIYDIPATIVEYQMNSQASVIFDHVTFKWFTGLYGVSLNLLAFIIALLGTRYFIKKLGLRICLLLYPMVFAITLVGLYIFYIGLASGPLSILWATFGVMLVVKAMAFAVNNPVKDMMYMPTSKDAKFKVKGIIDMLGGRSAKGTGAHIGGMLNVAGNPLLSIHHLMIYGSLIGLGVIGVWIVAAIFVGTKYNQLTEKHEIIE